MHQAQKNVTGYFGGYTSKAQPVGLYEMQNNRKFLDHLKTKLLYRKSNPTNQMSHAVMRMFTALEAKGVCRPITQEFHLASEYVLHGKDYVAKVENLSKDPSAIFDSVSKIKAPSRQKLHVQ